MFGTGMLIAPLPMTVPNIFTGNSLTIQKTIKSVGSTNYKDPVRTA